MSASHADQVNVSTPTHRPEGWQVKLIGELTDVSAGGTPATAEESYWNPPEVPWMSSGEVHQRRVRMTEQHISKLGLKNSAAKVFPKKSIVMALAGQGKTRGCVAVLEAEVATNQSLAAIYPSDAFETDFLFHNLDWRYKELRALSSGEGGRGGLNLSIIKSIPVELPSKGEQKKIAAILTAVDDKLDVIARQIETTQTLKQGLMQTLFSRGVGTQDADGRWVPHTEFKDSELGEIPATWEVRSLNDVADNLDRQRVPLKQADRAQRQGKVPYYGASGVIDWIDDFLFDGDFILLGEDGENVLSRKLPLAFRATGRIWVNNHAHVLRPKVGYDIQFLVELLESLDYSTLASGTAQPKITQQALNQLRFAVPPLDEQVRIGSLLVTVAEKTDLLRLRRERYGALKRGLMQKLLTGEWRVKVDADIAA